jgi:hypothetical protein
MLKIENASVMTNNTIAIADAMPAWLSRNAFRHR